MLDRAGNGDWELVDVVVLRVVLRLRSNKIVTKAIIIRTTTPPATPPAIAPTFVRDPVKIAREDDEVVGDGGRRDDSVPLVR